MHFGRLQEKNKNESTIGTKSFSAEGRVFTGKHNLRSVLVL